MKRSLFYAIVLFCTTFLQSVVGGGSAAFAQTSGALTGVKDLTGADPNNSNNWITDENDYTNDAPAKTFFLYNVGTGQFLNMGGVYGTHVTLSDTPKYIFIYNNTENGSISTSPTATKLNLRTKQSTLFETGNAPDKSTDFIAYVTADKQYPGVYVDRSWNNSVNGASQGPYGWTIEPAKYANHSDAYVLHQTVDGKELYLSAEPNGNNGNNCEAKAKNGSANQEWKFITLEQYSKLFNVSPASLSAPTDASFLIKDPDLSINNKYAQYWKVSDGTTIMLGTDTYFKISGADGDYQGDDASTAGKRNNYQPLNGRFFCGAITSASGDFYQDVTVNRGGWFIIRCKGFSNEGAQLFVVETTENSSNGGTTYAENGSRVTTALNVFTSTQSATNRMLQAGKDFAAGKYENQVMIYIEPREGVSTYHLRFGISVPSTNKTDGQTIFDSFRMLYATSTGAPDLILDEDNFDMNYLTETTDEYKNAVLFLRRSFTLNKWNTFILPVSLTYGQMKRTFGDDVRLARLNYLTDSSIRFVTVEPASDNDVMLQAYTPYIIKPTKAPGNNTQDEEELHVGSSGSTQPWKGAYKGTVVTEGKISIPENHYVISMVTLDRKTLPTSDNINTHTNRMDEKWVSVLTDQAVLSDHTMNAYGTLAKTYNNGEIIEGRDNLSGAYYMKGNNIYQVPSGKSYGLKAFRCWFKPGTSGNAKRVEMYLDDVLMDAIETTGISSVFADNGSAKAGIYSISGQLMGYSLQGLPSGLYVVNGKKIVVR